MKNLMKYEFEGNKIAFELENGLVMINATEMAKSFKKKPDDFLKTKQIQEYIKVLCQFENIRSEDVVKVVNGGNNPGTWLHELIALRFAQWLSPHFSIWVDKKIRELLIGETSKPVVLGRILDQKYAYFTISQYENGFIIEPERIPAMHFMQALKEWFVRTTIY